MKFHLIAAVIVHLFDAHSFVIFCYNTTRRCKEKRINSLIVANIMYNNAVSDKTKKNSIYQ